MNRKVVSLVILVALLSVGAVAWKAWSGRTVIPADSADVIAKEREAPNATYTEADLKAHAGEGSCWLAIGGNVYDATALLATRFDAVLSQSCGTDATAAFADESRQETKEALEASYRVGTLAI